MAARLIAMGSVSDQKREELRATISSVLNQQLGPMPPEKLRQIANTIELRAWGTGQQTPDDYLAGVKGLINKVVTSLAAQAQQAVGQAGPMPGAAVGGFAMQPGANQYPQPQPGHGMAPVGPQPGHGMAPVGPQPGHGMAPVGPQPGHGMAPVGPQYLQVEKGALAAELAAMRQERQQLAAAAQEAELRAGHLQELVNQANDAAREAREAQEHLSARLACMAGQADAVLRQPLPALEDIVQVMEGALPVLREAIAEKRVAAARSEALECAVCLEAPRDTFLNCGHIICRPCSDCVGACPICRASITSRARAFV